MNTISKKAKSWMRLTPIELFMSILLVVLALFVCFYFYYIMSNQSGKSVVKLTNNWALHTGGEVVDVEVGVLGKKLVEQPPSEPLHLTKQLQETAGLDTLMLNANHQFIKVYLGEQLLFDSSVPGQGEAPGIGVFFVNLPPGYGGETLHLFISSPYAYQSMTTRPVYLGNMGSLHALIIAEAFPNLFYLFISLITGLFLIGNSIYSYAHGIKQADKLALGVFSVLWGLHCVSWDRITSLLFSPQTTSILSAELQFVYLIPFLIYARLHLTTAKKLTWFIQNSYITIVVVLHIGLLLKVIDYPYAVILFNYVIYAAFLPLVVIACLDFKKNNPLVRFLAPSVLLLFLGAVGTVLENLGKAEATPFFLAAVFGFICFNWVYNIRQILRQRMQERQKLEALEIKNQLMLNRYDDMRLNLEKVRLIRHEMNHHLSAIQILCTEGQLSRVEEYVKKISSETLAQEIAYSNNTFVDCIIADAVSRAKELGIQFNYYVNVPKSLPFPDADICSLLFNIFDNAFEASVASENKWINFKMIMKDDFLTVSCENSHCNEIVERNGNIITQKPEKEKHGYGIQILKTIAEKYGSTVVISYNTQRFSLKTVLQQ